MPSNSNDHCKATIGVCGLGQMGASAAVLFARRGYPVVLWGRDQSKVDAIQPRLQSIHAFLDRMESQVDPMPVGVANDDTRVDADCKGLASIVCTSNLADVQSQSTFVLECVAEQMEQKVELLKRLSLSMNQDTILMSCTSGLSITAMGRGSSTGTRLVGAHFWNPPHLMPVVEVIAGDDTENGLDRQVAALLKSIGKIPVFCKDIPGFLGNRLLHALWREAIHLVHAGHCTAEDVDLVTRLTFALRMPAVGPCENMDLVGLPLVADIQSYLLEHLARDSTTQSGIADKIEAGDFGMRSGKGFYDWSIRDPEATISARDLQIVNQLRFLRQIGRMPS